MTEVALSGGGLASVLVVLGGFLGAIGAGFMRYLWKKCQQLDKDYRELRIEFETMRSQAQEGRTRDYGLIISLQNKLVTLQVYIASLRGMLAEMGAASPEPPVLHEVPPVHPNDEGA